MQITRLCPADRLDPVPLQRQDSCCLAATDWLLDFVTWMPPLPSVPALIYRTMTAKANTAASILLNTVTEPIVTLLTEINTHDMYTVLVLQK